MMNEKVKLDEVLKYLFSTSDKTLINLLNSIFNENYNEDEVKIIKSNNEFVMDTLSVIRGDVIYNIEHIDNQYKVLYHIEFQTKNVGNMAIRMFEYGLHNSKESIVDEDGIKVIRFPKQRVIYLEENKGIQDVLKAKIILPSEEVIYYNIPTIKYWEYSDKDIIKNKMYPLLPLKLFSLRKEIEKAYSTRNKDKLNNLLFKAKNLAFKLAEESSEIYRKHEIIDDDFSKLLTAIQNLVEYLNRVYFKDNIIEEEVMNMTKTLYDPVVEERGIEKGIQKGIEIDKINVAKIFWTF